LCDFLISKHARRLHKRIQGVSPQAMRLLKRYSWPGNIRELDNVIERAVILTQDEILGVEDLRIFEPPTEEKWKTLKEVEREHIEQVLEYTNGDLEKAALILDIPVEKLREKLEAFSES
ncbi:MAG: helix-turn-helix domain-containing protein, partial [Candidatus Caldatribacteriaceae bacterium]